MVKETNYHIEASRQIIDLLEKKQSFIILGPTGSGKTYLIENVVIRYLDHVSRSFFGDVRRLYVRLSFNNIGREELEVFYNSFFPQFGFEVENFKNYTVDDVVEKICWGFRRLSAEYQRAFYIIVDDFEFCTESDINKLMMFKRATARLVLATNERRYTEKYSDWFEDFEKVVLLPITEEGQKRHFYKTLMEGVQISVFAYEMLFNRLNLMYFYPGAVKRAVEKLKEACGGKVISTEDIRRHFKLHRWGLKYRDLTIGLFLFVFVLFFMRFLFLRGPESYRYAIYAGLSVMGVWFYRLFARKLMRAEEDEFVALPEYAPEWYNKYSAWLSALLHINGYLLLLFVVLIVFDKEFKLEMLVGLPFAFLMDIDIEHSFVARFLKSVLKLIYYKFEFWIDDISLKFGHRGAIHSLLFALLVWLIFFPLNLISFWCWISVLIGLVSHLLIDALSPLGVPLFYPAKHRWVTPFSFSKQIPVGSLREGSAAITLFIVCLLLLPVVITTTSGVYELITKDPFTAIKKITIRENFLQYADIEGFNTFLSRYIIDRMKIVRSTGENLFLEGSNGVVYSSKEDINVFKIVRHTTAKKIKYVLKRIKVDSVMPLKDIIDKIEGDVYFVGELYMYSPISEIVIRAPSTLKLMPKHNILFGTDGVCVKLSYASRKMVEELLMFFPIVVRGEIEVVKIEEVG